MTMIKKQYLVYLGLGTEFVGLMAAFLFIGNYADERFGLKGFGMIGGVFFALIIWAVHFIIVARAASAGQLDQSDN